MQTLIPQPATATAQPTGRTGSWAGFGLTPLTLLLFCVGFLLAIPAFWHPHAIWMMPAWDVLLLVLVLVDMGLLPRPRALTVTRSFLDSPEIGQPTKIELSLTQQSDVLLDVWMTDDLHPSLVAAPIAQRVRAFPRDAVTATQTIYPRARGDFAMGRVYLRYRGLFKLVERWAAAAPVTQSQSDSPAHPQHVRVYPANEQAGENTEFYLMRARQIELQKRRLRLRGVGREFESLRDYQKGDELRNVSWTATARRGYLITRQFTVERSQQVWIVLDAGRLSRTAFDLKRTGTQFLHETETEQNAAHLLTVTQLDQAAAALHVLEARDGVQVVGFGGFAARLAEEVDHQAQVERAGAGRQRLLDVAAVGHQGKLVAGRADHLCQHDGGGGCLVELRDGEQVGAVLLGLRLVQVLCARAFEVEGGTREAAGVEDDPDLLRTLDSELAGDEVAAAGGCGPRDVAEFVAFLVVAQAFELASDAAQAQAALLELDLAGAHQVELGVFACLFVRRVNANALCVGG